MKKQFNVWDEEPEVDPIDPIEPLEECGDKDKGVPETVQPGPR